MISWEEHYRLCEEARSRPGPDKHLRLQEARKRVAKNNPEDWVWLREALSDPDKKGFVAVIFQYQPVPKRLFYAMLHAGVMEKDPSFNQWFIKPCVRSLGAKRVLEKLLQYLTSGTDVEKAGAASSLYWVYDNPRNENL